jgi:8-oxo-dGTP pyrophosphatase MutT (NUDIX family)
MPGRIDYFDDPSGPAATSIVPAANTIVVNDAGEILLIQRSDNGNWALPGGGIDLGESLPAAAVRETFEETGIHIEIAGLAGIYTDPRHVILYTGDGVEHPAGLDRAVEDVGQQSVGVGPGRHRTAGQRDVAEQHGRPIGASVYRDAVRLSTPPSRTTASAVSSARIEPKVSSTACGPRPPAVARTHSTTSSPHRCAVLPSAHEPG